VTQEHDENWIRESERDSRAVPEASGWLRYFYSPQLHWDERNVAVRSLLPLGSTTVALCCMSAGRPGLLTRNELKRISFVRAWRPCRRARC
jgi:hypothetical protein